MSQHDAFVAEGPDRTADDSPHADHRRSEPVLAPLPTTVIALQRSAGNAAVSRWLEESFRGGGPDHPPKEASGPAGEEETAAEAEEEKEDETGKGPIAAPGALPAAEAPRRLVVSATFVGDNVTTETRLGELGLQSGRAKREVKPTGAPAYDGAAAASDCLPADILPDDVEWDVVDKGKKWGVKVTKFTTRGDIKVNPTPNLPTTMTTPNTPNPVDGGNINDTAGSDNNWKFAISEMKAYHTVDGGKSAHWHSTAASDAHEWAHWNTDWMKNVLGGLWPRANRDIDAITIPKADAADEAAAKPLLKTKVDARISTANDKSTDDWNAVPDDPGASGANGYKAGQKVLNGLISSVKAYAKSKKWK
jgi:hypothetical protein